MSFHWDDKTVLVLIEKFHENDILWNPRNADYKNRNKRTNSLNKIASVFDINKDEVERKLKNLTPHYFREKKKIEQMHKSGAGIDEVPNPKWFAYKALNFLRNKNKPLPKINSENEDSQQDNAKASSSRKRRCGTDGDTDIAEALQVLKHISASSSARDDASIFGEYIASKIRKLDPMTLSTVQHLIQNIIYQAEMGVYSRPSTAAAAQGYFTTSKPESVRPSTSHSTYTDNFDTKDGLFSYSENN